MAKRIHFFIVIGPVCSWEKDLFIQHTLSNAYHPEIISLFEYCALRDFLQLNYSAAIFDHLSQINHDADAQADVLRIAIDAKAVGKGAHLLETAQAARKPRQPITIASLRRPSPQYRLHVRFADPPSYHRKYNPRERCWGILENHWNGALLDSIATALASARPMTWKGLHPTVVWVTTAAQHGVKLTKAAINKVETQLQRRPGLEQWVGRELPASKGSGYIIIICESLNHRETPMIGPRIASSGLCTTNVTHDGGNVDQYTDLLPMFSLR